MSVCLPSGTEKWMKIQCIKGNRCELLVIGVFFVEPLSKLDSRHLSSKNECIAG